MVKISKLWDKRWFKVLTIAPCALLLLWLTLLLTTPCDLFTTPYSTLLYSYEGELLGARIASDGQWRFPPNGEPPERFTECLVTFEDRRFFWHPGIDPLAIARAARLNIRSGRVVSGGSTLTMQLARLARGNRERTVWQKLIEMGWALYFEGRYSKRKILELYASHAPFGGNVIGVEAASWRYFGRPVRQLSWAESATLAVLPNSPAVIHPARNRETLRIKRNALLAQLLKRGSIDSLEYELGCIEPLPDAPLPLPNEAPHLLERLAKERPQMHINSSLRASLQRQTQSVVDRYAHQYASNHIHNAAALVIDVESGEVLAYAGNVSFDGEPRRGNSVDITTSKRSTGSILKPFLYAGMLHDGSILQNTLIADTPLNINGFSPMNYNKTFYGAVPAHRAIVRSLNVPLVRMLSSYNTGRFMSLLKSYGMTTLNFSEGHYGASLILGGAEGTLWDIVGMYGSMARTLRHYRAYNGRYDPRDVHPPTPYPVDSDREPILSAADDRLVDHSVLSAASIWFTLEAMSELNRPEEEADWQQFSSMKRVAWKTGTSYGGRDGWAIGTTPRYTIGVWVGNSSGEGSAALSGVAMAAPILFDLFSQLPNSAWFDAPHDQMVRSAVCRKSGYRASDICPEVDTLYIPLAGNTTPICSHHQLVHLSEDGRYRVNSSCESINRMITRGWFVLPPAQEYYYRNYNIDYRPLPPFRSGCQRTLSNQIELIYPEHKAVLFLPKGFSETGERFVFRAAHAQPNATIYWHLDDFFIGQTQNNHSISVRPDAGEHLLTLTDNGGNQRKIVFHVKQ